MSVHRLRPRTAGPQLIGTFTPGTDEWAEARARRIGGSECAAPLGLGFVSAYRLHWQKLGVLDGTPVNERMEWGTRLEPAIRAKFRSEHPDLQFEPHTAASYVHQDRDWQLASPDDMYADDTGMRVGLCEYKTSGHDDAWGPSGDGYGQIPVPYRCQVLWNCDVLGVRQARVAVLIQGHTYREYHLDLDTDPDADVEINILRRRAREFLDLLESGQHPEPDDGSESTYETVRALHPDIEYGTHGPVPADLAAEFTTAVLDADTAAAAKRAVANKITELVGTAHHLYAVNGDGEPDLNRFAYRTARRTAAGAPGIPYIALDPAVKRAMSITQADQKLVSEGASL